MKFEVLGGRRHLKGAGSVDEEVRGAYCLLTGAARYGLYLDLTWIHLTELRPILQRSKLLWHLTENTLGSVELENKYRLFLSEFLPSLQQRVVFCAPRSVRFARLELTAGSQTDRERKRPDEQADDSGTTPGTRDTVARPSSQLTGHLLSPVRPVFGTMSGDSWSRSMWRATWILFFSLLIHSTQAQGKRDNTPGHGAEQ